MGIYGKTFRLFAQSMNDIGVITLSDRAFRLWVNLKCCDRLHDGCLPSDGELAWYCRLKPKQFSIRIEELIRARFVERGADKNLALIPRNYENGRLPASERSLLRSEVFARDNYTCSYCGLRGERLECDHIFPLARGGSNKIENLTTACTICNRSKHAKLLADWNQ